jgi:hypothetical protein
LEKNPLPHALQAVAFSDEYVLASQVSQATAPAIAV